MNLTNTITSLAILSLPFATLADDSLTKSKLDIAYKFVEQGPLKLDLHYPAAPKAWQKVSARCFSAWRRLVGGEQDQRRTRRAVPRVAGAQ